MLNVLDLFCGAGGLSEGFKQAGFNVVLGIDNDESSLKTFKLNHSKTETLNKDVSTVTKKDITSKIGNQKINIVIGGPPCQGFSMAGNRSEDDSRNVLFLEYVKYVEYYKPKLFMIENVSYIY